MSLADCFRLFALGAIPLLLPELVKVVRRTRRQRNVAPDEYANWFDKKTGRVWRMFCLAVKKFSEIDGSQSAGAFAHLSVGDSAQ